jgi:hypothetical protein
MTNAKKDAERLAQLEAEVAALKAKVDPPKSTFVEMSDAEWRDKMHQAAERRANSWMPPNAVQAMANHPCNQVMGGVVNDRHAPNTPGTLPRSQSVGNAQPVERGTGWSTPTPLRPPDGVAQADRLMDAADKADRIELAQRIAAHEAAMRAALGKK